MFNMIARIFEKSFSNTEIINRAVMVVGEETVTRINRISCHLFPHSQLVWEGRGRRGQIK